MRIQITQNTAGITSVKVDGVELNGCVSEFCLSQKGHEAPELLLKIPIAPLDSLDVDLPEGVVIVDNTRDEG